jgi:ketosteroid isomerase-like protein
MSQGQADPREQNKAIARQLLEAWNSQGETHLAEDLISPHLVTTFARPITFGPGTERDRALYEAALPRTAITGQRFQEQILIAEGDTVFVAWAVTGRHEGELYGRPPTHQEVTTYGSDVLRIVDGKIIEHRHYYGKARVHALARLGLLDEAMQRTLLAEGLITRGAPSGIAFRAS